MQKLSERDIRWIVKQKMRNSRTNNETAQYRKRITMIIPDYREKSVLSRMIDVWR